MVPPIEYFFIGNMHGYKDVRLDFYDLYKILLSENGQGKTTILKIIDATLNGNIKKLRDVNFGSVEIKFASSSEPISIMKSDLDYDWESKAYRHVSERVSQEDLSIIIDIIMSESSLNTIRTKIKNYYEINPKSQLSHSVAIRSSLPFSIMAIRDLFEEKESLLLGVKKMDFFQQIEEKFTLKTLYLPTYRRVEDLLSSLNVDKEKQGQDYIQFGLTDVEDKLESIKKEILTSSNDSMSRINSEILNRLINGLTVNDDDRSVIINNSDDIELLLNRFGRSLTPSDKNKIISLVKNKYEVGKKENDTLIYFLSKMYNAFFEQQTKDKALTRFSEVCSKYFKNKKMTYDATSISVVITSLERDEQIKFGELSSGEKQIVSLFSTLILERDSRYFILFDEPELSLSVEWQKILIKDVMECESCSMLLAMTHSPFIFSGLTKYTSDLQSYFLEKEGE
ncbi:ATP-binding protein [Lelliottia amnigena]|uniref:AAA family ATPase n=1 Tax=Lelliottia amnigena TaxID=61646 RepID=UPI001576E43D|nr:AAA family ATPase [Lelliottia amnigena]NTX70317.1 ATP-binding protein [Lelliottia amnigena]